MTEENINFKCVVIGDDGVGKTCMLISYLQNTFPDDYVPTVYDGSNQGCRLVKDNPYPDPRVTLGLWDTACQEDYDRLRPHSYPETNLFLILFSLVDPASLEHVRTKWVPEIQAFDEGVPFFLVGTKLDLRRVDDVVLREMGEESGTEVRLMDRTEGEAVASELGALGYRECSAKTQEGLKEMFEAAVGSVVSFPRDSLLESICCPWRRRRN